MAKFFGKIGYMKAEKTKPGVYTETLLDERDYSGEYLRITGKTESSGGVNDNININHQISIVADPFAIQNFHYMKYVIIGGVKWKIKTVELNYPRLILSIGDEFK